MCSPDGAHCPSASCAFFMALSYIFSHWTWLSLSLDRFRWIRTFGGTLLIQRWWRTSGAALHSSALRPLHHVCPMRYFENGEQSLHNHAKEVSHDLSSPRGCQRHIFPLPHSHPHPHPHPPPHQRNQWRNLGMTYFTQPVKMTLVSSRHFHWQF